jgi:hypothetical protein
VLIRPFRDWLAEQERRRRPLIFVFEWLGIFALSLTFWTVLFLELHPLAWSMAAAGAVASLYSSAFVYVRLLALTTCRKCKSSLALSRDEISRRYVHEIERCLEIEHGGEEWYGHFIDLYSRRYRTEIVRYRCRRCHSVWDEETELPVSDYVLVRTIELKD